MESKIDIEKKVTSDYLLKTINFSVDKDELKIGLHYKNEPDIIYNRTGIEVGAVISSKNTLIEKYEKLFLEKANKLINGKLNEKLFLKLVFHEDKDYFEFTPKKEFIEYKYLSKYLDGFYIHLSALKVPKQIYLNQIDLMRTDTFPNTKNKEIENFIIELVDFVNTRGHDDFKDKCFMSGRSLCSHYVICDGKQIKEKPDPVSKFFSEKIIEKFKKDKYEGDFNEKTLLLHNYNPLMKKQFTSDMHFYSHYKDHIFNEIHDLITKYNSYNIYKQIFFIDYSLFPSGNDCTVIDFSSYIKKELGDLSDDGHIRVKLDQSVLL